MTLSGKVNPAAGSREARGVRLRRLVRRAFYVKLSFAFAIMLVVGVAYLRLVAGPVSLQDYSQRVGDSLASRLGPGWHVVLKDTALQLQGAKPAVRASGLEIRNPAGVLVVNAPYAIVSLDPVSLLTGTLLPHEVDLRDLQLRAILAADGTLSFLPSTETPPDPAAAAPPAPVASVDPSKVVAGPDGKPSPLSQAISSLLAPIMKSSSLIGALERATVSDARLSLVGADGRERVAFGRVDALFERSGPDAKRLGVQIESKRGPWSIGGEVRDEPNGRRFADLNASGVPLEDILLLTGLNVLPGGSDLKLSGHVAAALADGRLTTMNGRFETSPGSLARLGQSPLAIDLASGDATWDEARRRLEFPSLSVKSGDTQVQLAGELAAGTDGDWNLKLSGRDATVAGVTDRDPAFKVADLGAEVKFGERGIVVDRLTLKGDQLDIKIVGATVASADGTGMRAVVEANGSNVRRLLRLWPDTANPELRGYLVANLQSGTVEKMRLKADLNPEELKAVTTAKPISDTALSLSFTLADAKLNVMEGLPPLSRLTVDGSASGTKVSLATRSGVIELSDGRSLNFTDGTYNQTNLDKPGSIAKIGFRLDGGADAVASFLRAPILHEAGAFDIDPALVKGRADLKVSLPLDPKRIPRAADMPLLVTGTVSGLSADRLMGRERLEGGEMTLAYDSGALTVKGDGRLGGSPATFDLRQARGQAGEMIVNLNLDEAARLRRGLPSGPKVTGPVSVKVTTPFGAPSKAATRLEADLGRAAIDGILPGWTKPAGRPGRLSFSTPDGDSSELKDFVLDSGPVQLRGHVGLARDGSLDKADLSTVKLSPGDDLRAQIDRGGGVYRVNLRGNMLDVRPALKWVSGSGGSGPKARDSFDVEVDAAINIVTGHNDEAMTGVMAKLATKGGDLRALQIGGQFRQARLDAQLDSRSAGQPVLVVQSGDAGSTLRFLDIYKRVVGGRLEARVTPGEVQAGSVTINSFALRNEPALKSIASAAPAPTSGPDDRGGTVADLGSDQVQFTKLTADFRRSASRVDYKDVVIWGSQVGFNLQGYVDYGRDRTDILGTFVPAYGLNNAFSQVPIVGLILGGDRNEGLFAIDFKLSGSANSPSLSVNPLTAVAPGILRKLFGWMMPEPETLATGTTATRAPARRSRTN